MTGPDVLALGRPAARNAVAAYGAGRAPRYPSLPAFMQARYFSINMLSTEQAPISRVFSSAVANRFDGVEHTDGQLGVPLIGGCAAHLECRNETRHYSGDHVIFIGHVVHCTYTELKPLVFSQGQYTALS